MNVNSWGKTLLTATLCVSLVACSSAPSSGDEHGENVAHSESAAEGHKIHWSYTGATGAEHWGSLDTLFHACAEGKEQSPIDLEQAKIELNSEADIEVKYQSSLFTIKNNGHTIQADATTQENFLVLDGKEYTLAQFHFHAPSEHEIDGELSEMEVHFVHTNSDNELAVLGILMKKGSENEYLNELWSILPEKETETNIELEEPLALESLLPENKRAFHYNGSLTTPPCSEGVKWTVLAEAIEVSQEQIDAFTAIFPDNHRPVQPWNDRDVFEVLFKK